MSLYLLDTNTVSFTLWGISPAARLRLANLPPHDSISISAVTEGELLFGLAKSPNERRRRALEQYLNSFVIYPWGREAATVYGYLRARQERLGKKLGPYDTQIAAHAVSLNAILVSHDKAFRHIPNLQVENWATDVV